MVGRGGCKLLIIYARGLVLTSAYVTRIGNIMENKEGAGMGEKKRV